MERLSAKNSIVVQHDTETRMGLHGFVRLMGDKPNICRSEKINTLDLDSDLHK